jgi:hypothetical protein
MTTKEISVFISYSHIDNKWFRSDNELFDLIPFLERSLDSRNVKFWYDRHKGNGIEAGDKFKDSIEFQIDRTDIALLLISQEFLDSRFISEKELPKIRERYEKGNLFVFPILLEPCDWEEIEFISSLQLVPGKSTPLIEFTDKEKNWKQVRFEILRSLKKRIDKISGIDDPMLKVQIPEKDHKEENGSLLPEENNKLNSPHIQSHRSDTITTSENLSDKNQVSDEPGSTPELKITEDP